MRNRLHVAVFLGSLSLIALLFVTTCTDGTKESSAPVRDSLTLHLPVPVLSANPLTYVYAHERWIIQYTHASLYILDKQTMKPVPELALTLPKKSADKRTWTISLRRDALWHDEKPVTARDVEASFAMLKDITVDAVRQRAVFSKLESVKALDEFTCELTYSEEHALALLALVDLPILPKHVLDGLEKPSDLNDMDRILGSGPYKIESLDSKAVVLVRNDGWFGAEPKLERITYRTVRNMNAAITDLRRGQIDAMGVPYPVWKQELSKDTKLLERFNQLRYHRPSYRFVGWNCSRPIFSDKLTRQALALLFDVQKYLENNFHAGSRRVTGPFFFKSTQHNPAVKPLPYDPSKAVKLLETAGWTDSDGDDILDRNGEKFEFTLLFLAGMGESENLVAALQDACKKVGINVIPRGVDNAALREQLKQGDFDSVAYGLGTADPEIDPYQTLHSDSSIDRGPNYYQFKNTEADTLMEKARKEFNEDARNAHYHDLHRLVYDEQPFMFLLAPEYLLLVNKKFQGAKAYGLGLTPRIGIEWWIDPDPDPDPDPDEEKSE